MTGRAGRWHIFVSRDSRGKAALRVLKLSPERSVGMVFSDGSHGRVRNTLIVKEFTNADDHKPRRNHSRINGLLGQGPADAAGNDELLLSSDDGLVAVLLSEPEAIERRSGSPGAEGRGDASRKAQSSAEASLDPSPRAQNDSQACSEARRG